MRTLVQITLAATAALAIASPAASEDAMIVKLVGVNLDTDAGAQVALQRIRFAAREFCGPDFRKGLADQILTTKCQAEMTEKAIRQLNATRVTALHRRNEALRLAQLGTR